MDELVGNVVMPGDVIFDLDTLSTSNKVIFGPGLRREDQKIFAVKCGTLKKSSNKVYYVDNHQKKYVPVRGESVIGTVVKKGSDEILVDIGSSEPAVVDLLSFEGATKRNKPNIKVGDIIFGKIIVACKDTEPELVCVNSYGKSVGFGVLPEGGFVFPVSLDYCRRNIDDIAATNVFDMSQLPFVNTLPLQTSLEVSPSQSFTIARAALLLAILQEMCLLACPLQDIQSVDKIISTGLLLPDSPILKRLGLILPFETAIGLNGRVWLKSTSLDRTLVLVQALSVLEYAAPREIEMMCEGVTTMNIA